MPSVKLDKAKLSKWLNRTSIGHHQKVSIAAKKAGPFLTLP
jgi:hypothetical protein